MVLVRLGRDDLKIILKDFGSILFVIGVILLLPVVVAFIFNDESLYLGFKIKDAFLYPSAVALWIGFLLKKIFKDAEETKLRHAMINAALVYIFVPLIGAVPFFSLNFSLLDGYFESMSGFTTTGMTIIKNVEMMPKSILFWRALTQWVGGVGVIMLFFVVFVEAGAVIKMLYFAEGRSERIKPTVSATARYIWGIYILYTALGVLLYLIAGMNLFDAICHTFAGLSTAGFSTRDGSIGAYDSIPIEAVSIFIMFLGGISFLVHYKVLSGNREEFSINPEIKAYLGIIGIATLLVAVNLTFKGFDAGDSIRYSLFQVVSAITTTGFSTGYLPNWPDFSKAILMFLMISGGCVGSTSGGIKILRTLILSKFSYLETTKAILPEKAVLSFKVRGKIIENEELLKIASFFFLYVFIVFVSGLVMMMLGSSFLDAVFTATSAQGDVGLVSMSPEKWLTLPDTAKSILILEMWIGRLEIFPALALISSLLIVTRRQQKSTS